MGTRLFDKKKSYHHSFISNKRESFCCQIKDSRFVLFQIKDLISNRLLRLLSNLSIQIFYFHIMKFHDMKINDEEKV